MKVLNLRCTNQHLFEGWFRSEDDYRSQSERGLVECPLCADKAIVRLPSAPRVSVSRPREPEAAPVGEANAEQHKQARWLQAVRHLMETTEDVGERFPEEARRIHYGEVRERGIRGRATSADTDALREEGIEVMAFSLPAALKGPVQ